MARGGKLRRWAAALACALALALALAGCGVDAAGQIPADPMTPATAAPANMPKATASGTSTPSQVAVQVLKPALRGVSAQGHGTRATPVSPLELPAGTLFLNPASGRKEIIDPAITRSAVLMGDSQSGGAAGVKATDTWVERALTAQGYKVHFVGAGGRGFVAGTSKSPNYPDSVESGRALLPYGNPALVVVQGGGNDAALGAPDAQIRANAARLVRDLRASYPTSKFLLIGTLAKGGAKGSANAGGRRSEVDATLGDFARRNGLPFISAGDWLTRYRLTGEMADRVHLTADGHTVLTGVLAGKLGAMGLKGPAAG
ncbi:GDSL family lipase [Arthrobacter livingstonensis]|uniref:GDSL family lipase n=1 Tax=Arthrobacter livingstonensis TaxID=670078 RepID=A0A2V5L8Q2_9MICC|nr:SGNH/GDSL hydrolase family protein [Arthrobacter livingstonensis]PYI67885.1 GDSL family lipase [Arthrobacter livingstonensis]